MKKKDLDKIKNRLEDSKKLESVAIDIASIFKLFEFQWANVGEDSGLYIPEMLKIKESLIELILQVIKDDLYETASGRLFAKREEKGLIRYGLSIEFDGYFDLDNI